MRISALETVGNLSFQVENRAIFLADADLMEWVIRLARDQVPLYDAFPAQGYAASGATPHHGTL